MNYYLAAKKVLFSKQYYITAKIIPISGYVGASAHIVFYFLCVAQGYWEFVYAQADYGGSLGAVSALPPEQKSESRSQMLLGNSSLYLPSSFLLLHVSQKRIRHVLVHLSVMGMHDLWNNGRKSIYTHGSEDRHQIDAAKGHRILFQERLDG